MEFNTEWFDYVAIPKVVGSHRDYIPCPLCEKCEIYHYFTLAGDVERYVCKSCGSIYGHQSLMKYLIRLNPTIEK